MDRSSGVLMHITSLPGKYGIGKFGSMALKFARFLKNAGFTYWQVLPFGPVGFGNSPYQSFSAFAGYIGMIDPEALVRDGLIYPYELKLFEYRGGTYTVDYDFANAKALGMMHFAFPRLSNDMQRELFLFSEENKEWLDDYALFMVLKEKNRNRPFWEWIEKDLVRREPDALAAARAEYIQEISFWKFVQYIFYKQWFELKAEINKIGIRIIGDMPIYVSRDSSDLWASPELFKLDSSLNPTVVAGVPPDFFSEDGQLWGNPIYNWDKMEMDGYAWWIRRIRSALNLFDSVRIDHFRGFESYWEVPFGELTAKKGIWRKGPAMKLFHRVRVTFGDAAIIAEDLGDITEDVRTFLTDSGYPGMKVLQFAFDPDLDSEYLPHNYKTNTVVYTGTHDNNTTLGWLWAAKEEERAFALSYCGFEGEDWGRGGNDSASLRAVIRTLWQSCADLAIVPIQDLCGFGCDARMNVPGTVAENWKFRLTYEVLSDLPAQKWRKFNIVYKREKPDPKPAKKTLCPDSDEPVAEGDDEANSKSDELK